MITEDYVSFETAKLLKEKGFDESTLQRYGADGDMSSDGRMGKYNSLTKFNFIAAPTLQMAMKWLREVHNLHIDIFVTYKDGIPHYQWSIDNLKTQDTISETPCCNAYEEACEAAINYCLKNLI